MGQVFEFKVEMTCEGCSGAVQRILDRHVGKGVEKFDINLQARTVTIETTLTQDEITAILEKCGKQVTFLQIKA